MLIHYFITSEDVCWNIRNVKFKSFSLQKCVYIYHYVYHCGLRFGFCNYGLKTKTQLHQTRLLKNYKTFPTIEGVFEKYITLLRTSN